MSTLPCLQLLVMFFSLHSRGSTWAFKNHRIVGCPVAVVGLDWIDWEGRLRLRQETRVLARGDGEAHSSRTPSRKIRVSHA